MAVHRYWRLNITSKSATNCYIVAAELRETSLGANLAITGQGTASASAVDLGAAAAAFDASGATQWGTAAAVPTWLQWDFGAGFAYEIKRLTITNYTGSSSAAVNGTLQFSDNGSTWTDWITFVNSSGSGATTSFDYLVPGFATADLNIPAISVSAFGGGSSNVSLTNPQVFGGGGATCNVSLPSITASGYFGSQVSIVIPTFTCFGSGHDATDENALNIVLPKFALAAYGGGNTTASISSALVSIEGTFNIVGSANTTAPAAIVAASGFGGGLGSAEASLTDKFIAIGYSGAIISATVSGITAIASGTSGSVGWAAVELPLYELNASGAMQNFGSADIMMPAIQPTPSGIAWLILPGFTLTAIGTAVVTATYEAYAINLIHKGVKDPVDEVTRYTNFPFERIVRYQNSYFGVAADGLYLLEGTTDHATPATTIPWEFKTHLTDFENPKEKTVVSAYFGGRMGKAETITLYAGEKTTKAYKYKTTRGSTAQNHREKFGRGIKARYFAVGADGADVMELDNIEFNIHSLTRRI